MIIKASFENILSFNDETTLDFIAQKSDNLSNHVLRAQKRDDISILKTGMIYGPNATGKSNTIKAIWMLQQIALGKWPQKYMESFKMKDPDTKPSKMEISFKYEDKYYTYGISFTIQGILEEWLQEINKRSAKKVYTRTKNENEFIYRFYVTKVKAIQENFLFFLGKGTPPKKSFLSEYISRNGENLEAINKVYAWFSNTLQIIFPESRYQGLSFRFDEDKEFKENFNEMLRYFNTDIIDIGKSPLPKESTNLPKEIIDDIFANAKPGTKSFVSTASGEWYFFETSIQGITSVSKQQTIHATPKEEYRAFNMSEESEGTLRLLDLLPMLIKLRSGNTVFLVDEIDRSLHLERTIEILQCYLSNLTEYSDSQLIATTHEFNLINANLLRQDEIWLAEKDINGATHLTRPINNKFREIFKKSHSIAQWGEAKFNITKHIK